MGPRARRLRQEPFDEHSSDGLECATTPACGLECATTRARRNLLNKRIHIERRTEGSEVKCRYFLIKLL